jgi:hypothetical protein
VRRVYHNIHLSGHQAQHGPDHKGEPGVDGRMRGPQTREPEDERGGNPPATPRTFRPLSRCP